MATNESKTSIDRVQQIKNNLINKDPHRMCWMRAIEVTLTSQKTGRKMVFSTDNQNQFTMDITGYKRLALLEDKGTLSIWNLEYDKIMQIILQQYYTIEIKVGYKSLGTLNTIFKGEVSFITQKIHSKHDVETYINFASTTVAKYSQSRMNYNFNAGYNIYGALNYAFHINGIGSNVKISPELKKEFLDNVYSNYTTLDTVVDYLALTGGNYDISSDSSEGNVINVTTINDKRRIKIDPDTINITRGNPTVNSNGLNITLLPTINFMPGDILQIDNSIADVAIRDADAVYNTFNSNYLDQNGEYMIREIQFHFQNRGDAFEYNIRAWPIRYIDQIQMGGT